ncbi:MAG TPA: asparagine synthase-related protein, partial [Actinomycetes bacterium]|nr:asparagine synthase-related protein [Actinomycetes bacterium]
EPACRAASGGSLLTGLEGDGLFGGWRWRHLAGVLARRERPQLRDPVRLAIAAAPHALRRSLARGQPAAMPWLSPAARRALGAAWRAHAAAEPASWGQRVEWYAGLRFHALASGAIGLVACDLGVEAVHPLLDRRFLAALARDGGRLGFGDRTRAMEVLFADALPEAILRRQTKAAFTHAYFGPASRGFASAWGGPRLDRWGRWDGTAVAGRLVDAEALRAVWAAEVPDDRSTSLLQAAWLSASTASSATAPKARQGGTTDRFANGTGELSTIPRRGWPPYRPAPDRREEGRPWA